MQRLRHIALVFVLVAVVALSGFWLIQQAAAVADAPGGNESPAPGLALPPKGLYTSSATEPGDSVAADRVPLQQSAINVPASQGAAGYTALCRLGVDLVSRPITDYPLEDLAKLRAGWYFNWTTQAAPSDVNGMRYAQAVWVKQWKWDNGMVLWSPDAPYAQPYTYTLRPSIENIKFIAAANPGSLWLIGNEIERRDWGTHPRQGQNEILPEVYAWAYHQVYQAIKEADPSARVANGSIVAPTPLRLQYMDRVWDEYKRRFGQAMPVDVWHIHTHLGPEERGEWGIGIPAGLDAEQGMFCFPDQRDRILVNKDYATAVSLIRDFRVWMKAHGQQNKPLVLSEFGVTMPYWVDAAFTPEAIRDEFMVPGLNYLLNTTDPELGYPADEYRLVQTTWWWSLDGDMGKYEQDGTFYEDFNGNLFWSGLADESHSPNPMGFTTLGYYWLGYTSSLLATVNLRPVAVDVLPQVSVSTSGLVTATLEVKTANSGSVTATQVFTVALYDGAQLIDSQPVAAGLDGCGTKATVRLTWPNVLPGLHTVRVVADDTNQVGESRESDNESIVTVLVPKHRVDLPIVRQ